MDPQSTQLPLWPEKRCTQCGETKPLDQFHPRKNRRGGYRSACKPCEITQAHAWNVANRERVYENKRRWLTEHPDWYSPEKAHEYYEAFKARHPGRGSAQSLARYHANPAAWWTGTTEQHTKWARRYRERHPEKVRANYVRGAHRRRVKMAGLTEHYTRAEWEAILERYGHRCLCCGATDRPLTVDHIVPIALGGPNTADNLQPLCKPCNSRKKLKVIDYRG